MVNLDKLELISKLDTQQQFVTISQWSKMIEDGFYRGKNLSLSPEFKLETKLGKVKYLFKNVSSISICGMGGSAISGEYLQTYLGASNFYLPIQIIRGYKVPNHLFSNSLLIAISYSGNTRETLTCVYHALNHQVPVIMVSSGGLMEEMSLKYNIPFVKLPSGLQPRAAFPVLFSALCGVIISLFPKQTYIENDLMSLKPILKNQESLLNPEIMIKDNFAKRIAIKWQNVIPLFITEFLCLGMRMKGQLNENSKKVAYFDLWPELMHNTVQGWKDEAVNSFHIVRVITDVDRTEFMDKTSFSLNFVTYKEFKNIDDLVGGQETLLQNLFCLTYLVDYISLYLAVLRNIDPSDIDVISGMKNKFESILTQEFNVKEEIMKLFT